MNLKLYLDTSIISAFYDSRVPDRLKETEDFFKRMKNSDMSVSTLTKDEIAATSDPQKRDSMQILCRDFRCVDITDEMRKLGSIYVDLGVFTEIQRNDALHVAIAVLSGQNILVSWNFRHLVNRQRRALINATNTKEGLPEIEILSPSEIY